MQTNAGPMSPPSAPPDEQQLCKACGLCCNGVWFSHVNLEPDEPARAKLAGLQVTIVDDKPRASMACPLHQGGQCSAYNSWRPAVCANYRCQLLVNFADGQLNLQQALAHVAAARTMADRIRAEVGDAAAGLVGTRFLSSIDDEGPPDALEHPGTSAGTKLDAFALNIYYAKFFKRRAVQPEREEPVAKPLKP